MLLVALVVLSIFLSSCPEYSQASYIDISESYVLFKPIKYFFNEDNETIDYDHEDLDEELCQPFKPTNLNFSILDDRISQKKCKEYIALVENQIREEIWSENCDNHSRTKKDDENDDIVDIPIIFGGQPALPDSFPHMGAIGWRARDPSVKWVFKCGSTLISEKFLLTAAHCSKISLKSVSDVIERQPEIVRLGVTDISEDRIQENRENSDIKIKYITKHPKYASPQKYYDIAVIELYEKVKITKSLHPACIWPYNNFNELGNKVKLTGWGYTEHGHQSEILQVATVAVLETSLCEQLFRQYRSRNWHGFTNHQICAGELAGGVDTCQGDSGGPIQIKMPLKTEGKLYWILGVTSFGIKCGYSNRPGIYTRVSSFIDWIEEVVWGPMK